MSQDKPLERPSPGSPGVPGDGLQAAASCRRPSNPASVAATRWDDGDVRRWFGQALPGFDGKSPAALIAEGRAGDVARYLKAGTEGLPGQPHPF